METIKIVSIKVENLKNVNHGVIKLPINFENLLDASLIGIYGQNGSGKTTVVDTFEILKMLISSWIEKVPTPYKNNNIICYDKDFCNLEFCFLISNTFGEFFVNYEIELSCNEEDYLYVTKEKLSYKENEKNKKFKNLIEKNQDLIKVRTKTLKNFNEDVRVKLKVVNELSKKQSVSFVFHKDLKNFYMDHLEKFEYELLKNIGNDFNRDLHIVNNESIGLLMTKFIMPFSIHLEKKRGSIPYDLSEAAILPIDLYKTLCDVIEQSNKVLQTIIPGLLIKINFINNETNDTGELVVRFEFLSKRGEIELPLRTESEGILKIISILSLLIAAYNNPNACIVIDEIDAGIFEFLLGELLEVLKEGGQGQLFFTSHNLRILEVLEQKDLWFTTANPENRYIQLKGIKKLNNMRDVYLRAIQLGGQEEAIYKKTKKFQIKRAFRKAGVEND